MARNEPQINIRIPTEIKEELKRQAEQNRRSLNAEIVYRLRESLKRS